MKRFTGVLAVAVLLVAGAVFAGNLDGTYAFKSRVKEGKPDLVGWTGMMKYAGATMSKDLKSPDGKEVKTYESNCTSEGKDTYNCKFTNAYKKEYIGQAYTNRITLNGNVLTIEAPDGKFKEEWTKK